MRLALHSFQKDLQKNLCNVAVPKTGVPLSLVCYSRVLAALFLAVLYPILCAVGALVRARRDGVACMPQRARTPD